MKVEKNTYTEEDLSQYDHFSSNLKTPIRTDAFDLSDKETNAVFICITFIVLKL